jgi:hypothetical protein
MATTEVRVTASFPLERPTDRMRRLAQGAAYKLQVLRGEVLNVDAAVLRCADLTHVARCPAVGAPLEGLAK